MSPLYQRHPEAEDGFSLPEVMVALAIFVVAGLAMLELSSATYYRGALQHETVAATALAQGQVEELLRAGYGDARLVDPDGGNDVGADAGYGPEALRDPDHADPNNPLDAEGGTAGPRRFTRVWNVGADVPLPGLKTVTVLVGWRDTRGQLRVVGQTVQIARLK
ncbi:MAG: prepilin-type N-terminal cleavage/methylation domain-containing protein [Candidatus Methylomirabilales bacterium]